MKFSDFHESPKALIGQYVLLVSGTSYGGTKKAIKRITGVVRKTFTIDGRNDFFRVSDGHDAKKREKMDVGNINYCELLTEDEAIALSQKWKEARELRELREAMLASVKEMSLEQLKKVAKIA